MKKTTGSKNVILSTKFTLIMKKFTFLLFGLLIIISCNREGSSTKNNSNSNTEAQMTANKTAEIQVTGMTCEGCENTVATALTKLDGVVSAKASYKDSVAVVTYDSTKVNRAKLTQAINDLGAYHADK